MNFSPVRCRRQVNWGSIMMVRYFSSAVAAMSSAVSSASVGFVVVRVANARIVL